MKININCLFISILLSQSFWVTAAVNFEQLIKNQQDIDRSTRIENNLEKNDVYSNIDTPKAIAIELPKEENCFIIDQIVIENNVLKPAALDVLTQRGVGRCLGVLGIKKLATEMQDYLISAGYITTRIEIPSQDLTTKTLTLKVVPGRIEKILIQDKAVRDWVLPFKKEDILNLRDIEQGLELIQRIPVDALKINVEPGNRDGYSNIVINITQSTRWNSRLWLNNWGDESTGKILANGAGYLYNLARLSDLFYLSGTTQAQNRQGGYQSVSTYYAIPFGYWEYEFFYSQSQSKQKLDLAQLDFNYQGRNTYLNFKGSRTVYRDQNKKIALSAELLRRKAHYQLEDVELVLQKRNMTNVRFGLNYKQQFMGAMFDTTLMYQRFVQWFGAQKTADMQSGDVSPHSHILNLDLNYLKYLNLSPFDGYYQFRVAGQYSPAGLTLQDQFSIGNRWSVRGFENSPGLNGDSGFYLQNTLNVSTGFKNIDWYLGLDYGQVWNKNSDYERSKLLGTTTGLSGRLYALNYDVSVSAPLMYPDHLSVDKVNLNFNLSYQL
ncbi:ShlB/FhaC/HecB family hemolysin secretion/activation protein [Utexia brackfieldae]|uniref:ShlB/FhaC/HecB family hemolysin secretion/activation protein n=1 Tax=Utexia brackfieldae TaxID=3074108 RepID=UPI00370DE227